MFGVAAAVAVGVLAASIALLSRGSAATPSASPTAVASALTTAPSLPGLTTGAPPWVAESANLRARLQSIGLPVLTAEGEALHTHQHLDLFVDGTAIPVPAEIGINLSERYLAPIHTHDPTGIIHVESPIVRTFTLGEFFDIWGVRFDGHCIGGVCDGNGRTMTVFVDGQQVRGDPRSVALEAHQEIVVAIGTTDQLPSPIPASYAFPAGL